MSAQQTVRSLLADCGREAERREARAAWVKTVMAAVRAAQKKADDAWMRIFAELPDDISEKELEAMDLPDPPEQAELDALHAQIRAVIDKDQWPRELYFGCV